MPVSHAFVNPKANSGDATITRPTDWNAGHVVSVNLATEVTGVLPAANMGAAGTTGQVQYNNAGALGGIAGSVVGTGFAAGSIAIPRITVGNATPLSGLSSYYFSIDGAATGREHGNASAQWLDAGLAGTHRFGDLSGFYNGARLEITPSYLSLYGGTSSAYVGTIMNNSLQMLADGSFTLFDLSLNGIAADGTTTQIGAVGYGSHTVIDQTGNMSVGIGAASSGAQLQVGPDFGSGGFVVMNGANTGSQTFFDFASGASGVSCSFRLFTDTQCGEMGAVGNGGEYFSNSLANDVVLKGDPGSANRFLIGVGSADSQVVVAGTLVSISTNLSVANSLINSATSGGTNDGQTWNDSTQKARGVFQSGIKQMLVGTIFTQTADKTVTNTVTETSILGTGVGTKTLPANFFVAGKTIRLRVGGVYSTPIGVASIVVKVKYGSTVIATVTTSSLLSGASSLEFDGEILITCRTTGSSGTVMTHGDLEYSTGVSGTIAVDSLNNGGAATTINTTTSNALDVTVTWDSATTTRIAKSTICTIEVIN